MTVDELLDSPALIAACAALAVGLISASTVILTAFVNFRPAKGVARDTFRRQMAAANAKPLIEQLDRRIMVFSRLIDAGPFLAKQLGEAPEKLSPEQRKAKIASIEEELKGLHQDLSEMPNLQGSTLMMSVIGRDDRVMDAAVSWARAVLRFTESVKTNRFSITSNPEQLAKMKTALSKALDEAVKLRIAVEDAVIQPMGGVGRALYKIRRRFKKKSVDQ